MRSTVRIDDDLMIELKRRAQETGLPLTRLLDRTLRLGLARPGERQERARTYPRRTAKTGRPLYDLDKALALASCLEDDEVSRKLALRK